MTLPIGTKTVICAITIPASGSAYATLAELIFPNVAAFKGHSIIGVDVKVIEAINVQDTNGGNGTFGMVHVYQFSGVDVHNQIKLRSQSVSTVAGTAILYCRNDGAK